MSTWKYGPIEVSEEDDIGDEKHSYAVEYNTTADVLSITRDGKWLIGFGHDDSKAVGKMIAQWYLSYIKNADEEVFDKYF